MQSANPTCSSDLRQSTFATNAVSCVAAVIVATIATVINVGDPVRPVYSKDLEACDLRNIGASFSNSSELLRIDTSSFEESLIRKLKNLKDLEKLRKLRLLAFHYVKKLPRELICQIQLFEFGFNTFKLIPLAEEVQLQLQNVSSTSFRQDQGSRVQPMVLEGITYQQPQDQRSRAILYLLNYLVQKYLYQVVPRDILLRGLVHDLKLVPRSLKSLPTALINQINQREQLKKVQLNMSDRSLSNLSRSESIWVLNILPMNYTFFPIELGYLKDKLVELLDNKQTIFYLFRVYIESQLALDSTFDQFIAFYKSIGDRAYRIDTGGWYERVYQALLMNSTGSSLRRELSPLIGPRAVLRTIIYGLIRSRDESRDMLWKLSQGRKDREYLSKNMNRHRILTQTDYLVQFLSINKKFHINGAWIKFKQERAKRAKSRDRHLELQILKDPLHFNPKQYCRKNNRFQLITPHYETQTQNIYQRYDMLTQSQLWVQFLLKLRLDQVRARAQWMYTRYAMDRFQMISQEKVCRLKIETMAEEQNRQAQSPQSQTEEQDRQVQSPQSQTEEQDRQVQSPQFQRALNVSDILSFVLGAYFVFCVGHFVFCNCSICFNFLILIVLFYNYE